MRTKLSVWEGESNADLWYRVHYWYDVDADVPMFAVIDVFADGADEACAELVKQSETNVSIELCECKGSRSDYYEWLSEQVKAVKKRQYRGQSMG